MASVQCVVCCRISVQGSLERLSGVFDVVIVYMSSSVHCYNTVIVLLQGRHDDGISDAFDAQGKTDRLYVALFVDAQRVNGGLISRSSSSFANERVDLVRKIFFCEKTSLWLCLFTIVLDHP
jgi:hypothetical protein